MRVVFMGTPDFAVPSLRALSAAHEVVAVYTRPDAVSGRGRALRPSPVKQAALDMGIAVRQPRTLRDPAQADELRQLSPDVVVVAAYGMILPPEILAVPPLGCVNVHASLLPRWRGAAPIQRAILAHDERVGVSIMRMEEGLDTGPYCATASTVVGDKDSGRLTAELAELGATALLDALKQLAGGTCVWTDQDPTAVTYAEKITKADVSLHPELPVADALARVRASSPQAPARILLGERRATVLDARSEELDVAPGSIACMKRALVLGVADGAVVIDRVKPDGRGEMAGCDWARGARLDDSMTWRADS